MHACHAMLETNILISKICVKCFKLGLTGDNLSSLIIEVISIFSI